MTAKLSRRFYERLGDDIVNELVEWFNAVDATYRADLRELNESKIERRLGVVEQKLADTRAELLAAIADTSARLVTWIVGLRITSALGFAGIILTLWRRS